MKNNILLFFIAPILISCGGGSSSSISPTTPSPLAEASPYQQVSIEFPDISPYVKDLCSEGIYPFVSSVMPVDLNGDRYKDIIVTVMCNAKLGSIVVGPTPNRVFIFEQKPDSNFSLENIKYFGSLNFSLGGNPSIPDIADLNNDGIPDFVFAVNREDGRAILNNGENQMWYPTALISGTDKKYKLYEFGKLDWMAMVSVAKNELNNFDVLYKGFGAVGLQAFRFENNSFREVFDYPANINAFTLKFLPTDKEGPPQNFIAAGEINVELYKKVQNIWSLSGSYSLPNAAQQVPFITWQRTITTANLYKLGDNYLIGTAFDTSCVVKMHDGSYKAIVNLNGSVLPGPYTGGTIDQNNLKPFDTLMGFDLNPNTVQHNPNLFDNVHMVQATNSQKLLCTDVNNDGLVDVVAYPAKTGGLPIIYLNDKTGKFLKISTSKFPVALSEFGTAAALLHDMDGDGVADLIYYPKGPDQKGKIIMRLHKGLISLTPSI